MKIAVRAGHNGETPNVLAITAPSWRWAASGAIRNLFAGSFRLFDPYLFHFQPFCAIIFSG